MGSPDTRLACPGTGASLQTVTARGGTTRDIRRSGCLCAERHCRCDRARRLILWRRARSRRDGYHLLACTGLPPVRRDHPETGLTHTRKAVASLRRTCPAPDAPVTGLAAGGSVTRLAAPAWGPGRLLGARSFREDLQRDLVAVERSGGAGVRLQVNEQVNDLILGDPVVEGDSQLAAQRLACAKRRGDGHRDERPASQVESRPCPGVPECVPGGEPPEVSA